MFVLSRERTIGFLVVTTALLLVTAAFPVFNPEPRRRDTSRWVLKANKDASASLLRSSETGFHVQVQQATKDDSWSVRVARMVELEGGERYELAFRATSPAPRTGRVLLRQGQPGGRNITGVQTFEAFPSGSDVRMSWDIQADEPDARIEFLIGDVEGSIEIEAISLRSVSDHP